ncbi:MAG: hypothetical protein K2X32_15885, partial [Phycisphaerales bacterium]|nr:hypothetical protein [Phycisphaerales bacterium]
MRQKKHATGTSVRFTLSGEGRAGVGERFVADDAVDGGRQSDARLLGDQKASLVFVDPPYNVPIEGHVSGKGRARHGEFAMASGEMSEAEFTLFLEKALALHATHSV